MRTLHSSVLAALADKQKSLVARDFLWAIPRNRDTGAPEARGYWSDVGTISADVINPDTGGIVTRTFRGVGTLIKISDVPLLSNLTVQNVTILLSQIDEDVNEAFRTYDLRQAPIQIHRGWFDQSSRTLINAAICRFVGFVDTVEVNTPGEGDEGGVTFTCVSHTQELLRANTEMRSDESQRRRNADDAFYQDVATVGDWEQFWGKKRGRMSSQKDGFGG